MPSVASPAFMPKGSTYQESSYFIDSWAPKVYTILVLGPFGMVYYPKVPASICGGACCRAKARRLGLVSGGGSWLRRIVCTSEEPGARNLNFPGSPFLPKSLDFGLRAWRFGSRVWGLGFSKSPPYLYRTLAALRTKIQILSLLIPLSYIIAKNKTTFLRALKELR